MQYQIAPPIRRLSAFLIDLLFIIPLITIAILSTNSLLNLPVTPDYSIYGFEIDMDIWAHEHFWQVVFLYSAIKLLILFLYYSIFEASPLQGTPGKRLLRI